MVKGRRTIPEIFSGGTLIVFFVLLLFSIPPASALSAERAIRIGFPVPLTGAFGKDGSLVRDAYLFWKETINAQ